MALTEVGRGVFRNSVGEEKTFTFNSTDRTRFVRFERTRASSSMMNTIEPVCRWSVGRVTILPRPHERADGRLKTLAAHTVLSVVDAILMCGGVPACVSVTDGPRKLVGSRPRFHLRQDRNVEARERFRSFFSGSIPRQRTRVANAAQLMRNELGTAWSPPGQSFEIADRGGRGDL